MAATKTDLSNYTAAEVAVREVLPLLLPAYVSDDDRLYELCAEYVTSHARDGSDLPLNAILSRVSAFPFSTIDLADMHYGQYSVVYSRELHYAMTAISGGDEMFPIALLLGSLAPNGWAEEAIDIISSWDLPAAYGYTDRLETVPDWVLYPIDCGHYRVDMPPGTAWVCDNCRGQYFWQRRTSRSQLLEDALIEASQAGIEDLGLIALGEAALELPEDSEYWGDDFFPELSALCFGTAGVNPLGGPRVHLTQEGISLGQLTLTGRLIRAAKAAPVYDEPAQQESMGRRSY